MCRPGGMTEKQQMILIERVAGRSWEWIADAMALTVPTVQTLENLAHAAYTRHREADKTA